MNYRRLGKTELQVSEIGFGGEWLERCGEEEGAELIRYAGRKGVNIIDCWMPDAKSRDIIGMGMEGNREKWLVQGHFGATLKEGQYYRTRDLSYVKPAFEDMLERMKTDYIDLGMIHFVDSVEEWEQILDSDYLSYIMDMKKKGVVRHIGMSSHNPAVAIRAAETGFVEMILFSINPAFDMLPSGVLLEDALEKTVYEGKLGIDPLRAEAYRTCLRNDVGITVMKPFAGGRLLDAGRSPFGIRLSPVQCIHYALSQPAVSSVLAGYAAQSQIDEALSYETAADAERDYTNVLSSVPMKSFEGKCMYCNHCKPCPMDIDIAMVNQYYDLAVMQNEVPASLRSHYHEMKHNADECIGCHDCESRCPFGVKIAERMEKARILFQ